MTTRIQTLDLFVQDGFIPKNRQHTICTLNTTASLNAYGILCKNIECIKCVFNTENCEIIKKVFEDETIKIL